MEDLDNVRDSCYYYLPLHCLAPENAGIIPANMRLFRSVVVRLRHITSPPPPHTHTSIFSESSKNASKMFQPLFPVASHPEFWMMMSPPRIHAPKSLFLKAISVSMTAATRGRLGSAFSCGRNLTKQGPNLDFNV